jgi:hypothetical protein
MKLALGVSLIAGGALVILYSILVGVMVPGWKASSNNLLTVLSTKAIAHVSSSNNTLTIPAKPGWFLTTVENVQSTSGRNLTLVIAIPDSDFHGNIEHGVVVSACAGLGVLVFLVLALSLCIHFCVSRQLAAKKTGDTSFPYTVFDELK